MDGIWCVAFNFALFAICSSYEMEYNYMHSSTTQLYVKVNATYTRKYHSVNSNNK